MTIYAINPLEQDQALPAVSTDSTACSITSINVLCMAIASREILVDICTMDGNRLANSPSPIQMTPMVSSAFQLGNSIRPDFFNPDVPDEFFDPSQSPGDDIITKLYQMIMYINQRPDDIEAVKIFYKFLQNLSAKGWLDGSDSRVAQMLNSLTINGKPVYLAVIDILGQAHFFDTQSKDWDAAFWDSLEFPGNNAISDQVRKYIESIRTGQEVDKVKANWSWAEFTSQYTSFDGKPKYTAEEWEWVAGGMWGDALRKQSNLSQWAKTMRLWMFDTIVNNPGMKDMALELIVTLLLNLTSSESYDDIAGFGAMGRFFADRTKDISEIMDLWKNPPQEIFPEIRDIINLWNSKKSDGEEGFQFMDMLEKLRNRINQSASIPQSIKDSIGKQIDIIGTPDPDWSLLDLYLIATHQKTDPHLTPLAARAKLNWLYKDFVTGSDEAGPVHDLMENALNNIVTTIGSKAIDPGMQFMDMLENLRFKIENSPFSASMKESFLKQLNEIENINFDVVILDSNHEKIIYNHRHSFKELYDFITGKSPLPEGTTKEEIAEALNNRFFAIMTYRPDPDLDPKDTQEFKEAFETIDYKLKSMSNCLTDQSQQQTTQLTKLTNDSEAELNMFNKCLNGETGILGLLNQLIRNQKGQ